MTRSLPPDPRFRAWLTEHAPRVAPPDLLARSMTAAAAAPQAGRWAARWPLLRFAAPATASVALLAAIGTGLLISRAPTVVSPTPQRTTSAAVTTPTPEPTASSSPPALPPEPSATPSAKAPSPAAFSTWSRVEMPDPAPDIFGGGTPADVVRFKDRFVAVGGVVTESGVDESRAVVWTSDDGVTWQLHEDIAAFNRTAVTDIVTDGNVMLAIGVRQRSGQDDVSGPAGWVSTDGVLWTPADGRELAEVAVGPGGFVGAVVEAETVRFVHSPDGRSWSDASATYEGEVTGIAVDEAGGALAVGYVSAPSTIEGTRTTDLVVWRSADGSSWDGPQVVVPGALPRDVSAGADGFVIVGEEYRFGRDGSVEDVPSIWRVTDFGVESIDVRFAEGQYLDRIFVLGETLVATGSEITDGLANAMVWVSSVGGPGWSRVPQQDAFEGISNAITGIAGSPDHLVAVGHRWDPLSGHMVPVAWSATR